MTATPTGAATAAVREWVTFADPEDADHRWQVDVTFLMSPWQCLFGCGCQGVLTDPAPELAHGCCSYGAHFTGEEDRDRVLSFAEQLRPDQWQLAGRGRRQGLVARVKGGGWRTKIVDGACVFLNRPGFPAGAGCALHLLALDRGRHPSATKPDVCWQLPLRRSDREEDDGTTTSVLSEFGRAGWGEGGAEFAWWCTEAPEAFVGHQAVYKELEAELVGIAGREVYRRLAGYLDDRMAGGTPVAHPVRRKT